MSCWLCDLQSPLIGSVGTTYATDCGLLESTLDTQEIPAAMSQPENLLISSTEFACANFVIFYLETTDLAKDGEITQIAASATDGEQIFEQFVVPMKNISPGASKVTGLYIHTAMDSMVYSRMESNWMPPVPCQL